MAPVLQHAHDSTPYLEKLAAALDGEAFATCLVSQPGGPPELTVTSKTVAGLAETITCDGAHYFYSWGRKITTAADVDGAARALAFVLRAGR